MLSPGQESPSDGLQLGSNSSEKRLARTALNLRKNKDCLMTKAELIEEVSRATQMPRNASEEIIDAIFDSVVQALCGGDRIEIEVLEALARACGGRVLVVIRKRALVWKFPPNGSLTSSRAKK